MCTRLTGLGQWIELLKNFFQDLHRNDILRRLMSQQINRQICLKLWPITFFSEKISFRKEKIQIFNFNKFEHFTQSLNRTLHLKVVNVAWKWPLLSSPLNFLLIWSKSKIEFSCPHLFSNGSANFMLLLKISFMWQLLFTWQYMYQREHYYWKF